MRTSLDAGAAMTVARSVGAAEPLRPDARDHGGEAQQGEHLKRFGSSRRGGRALDADRNAIAGNPPTDFLGEPRQSEDRYYRVIASSRSRSQIGLSELERPVIATTTSRVPLRCVFEVDALVVDWAIRAASLSFL